jgi:hypothetical protein
MLQYVPKQTVAQCGSAQTRARCAGIRQDRCPGAGDGDLLRVRFPSLWNETSKSLFLKEKPTRNTHVRLDPHGTRIALQECNYQFSKDFPDPPVYSMLLG